MGVLYVLLCFSDWLYFYFIYFFKFCGTLQMLVLPTEF